MVAMLAILYAVGAKVIFNNTVPGWAATFTAMMFFAGVQLICIGISGEYLARVYMQIKARPLYVVSSERGFPIGTPEQAAQDERPEIAVRTLDLSHRAMLLRSVNAPSDAGNGASGHRAR